MKGGVIMSDTPLTTGYYLGVSRSIRDFSFSLPNLGNRNVPSDMDAFFASLNSGKKITAEAASQSVPKQPVEKSTSHSGWIRLEGNNIAPNISAKGFAAPDIYQAAGGGDYRGAANCVGSFKKQAAKVLSRCADTGETIDESVAREINLLACVVHEIKVILLHVSAEAGDGYRFDPKTGLYYRQKTLRKFYVTGAPLDELLVAFAKELADCNTTVNSQSRLVAVRNDRVTPRTGRAASTRNFSIQRITDEKAMETDALLMAAVQRIRQKQLASG
jgi:hypothetical protein